MKYGDRDSWPKRRDSHVALCLGYGGQHKTVLISGGYKGTGVTLDDMWLLDPQTGRMEEVRRAIGNQLYIRNKYDHVTDVLLCYVFS